MKSARNRWLSRHKPGYVITQLQSMWRTRTPLSMVVAVLERGRNQRSLSTTCDFNVIPSFASWCRNMLTWCHTSGKLYGMQPPGWNYWFQFTSKILNMTSSLTRATYRCAKIPMVWLQKERQRVVSILQYFSTEITIARMPTKSLITRLQEHAYLYNYSHFYM